jgi:hypothetical protein
MWSDRLQIFPWHTHDSLVHIRTVRFEGNQNPLHHTTESFSPGAGGAWMWRVERWVVGWSSLTNLVSALERRPLSPSLNILLLRCLPAAAMMGRPWRSIEESGLWSSGVLESGANLVWLCIFSYGPPVQRCQQLYSSSFPLRLAAHQ